MTDAEDWANAVDPSTGIPSITIYPKAKNPLPVDFDPGTGLPEPTQSALVDTDQTTGPLAKLFGLAGNDRYQLWPEKLVRSATSLAHDVAEGSVTAIPGLRREDVTDIPPPDKPQGKLAELLHLPPTAWQPLDPLIERSQDMAALAGGAPLTETPGVASLGSGMTRMVPKDWVIKGFEGENWYHGTTHDFSKFDLNKGNPENHFGQYPHFTNNAEDASVNYAGHGPDLTGRIDNRADQIMNDKDLKYGTDEYKKAYEDAKAQAANEIAGPHEGAIIPSQLKLNNPVSVIDKKPTWLDFNAKYDKNGEWVKDSPLLLKLLGSLKKQGEKYGFDGQKVFDDVSEKASLYDGDVKASSLDKAMRQSDSLLDAQNNEGKIVQNHVIANVFKDLGYDGIVMDAKTAFPNMKNIPEGTLHAVPLKRNTVVSNYTGNKLFSDTSQPGIGIAAAKNAPVFYSAVENAIKNASTKVALPEQWLGTIANSKGVKPEELEWTGLKDWLGEQKGPVSKEAVQQYIDANKVQLKEVNKGPIVDYTPRIKEINARLDQIQDRFDELYSKPDSANLAKEKQNLANEKTELVKELNFKSFQQESPSTKYSKWQLPGGENYRETLLTLPSKTPSREQVIGAEQKANVTFQKLLGTIQNNELESELKNLPSRNAGHHALANDLIAKIEDGKGDLNRFKPEEIELGKQWSKEWDEYKKLSADNITGSKGDYKSSHWDEMNPIAHVRMNDRFMPDENGPSIKDNGEYNKKNLSPETYKKIFGEPVKGHKTLHLEEIQSDWHQQGREQGYKITDTQKQQLEDIDNKLVKGLEEKDIGNPDMDAVLKKGIEKKLISPQEAANYKQWSKGENSSIPDAPFKKSWLELAAKRMIREAAEKGYDRLSWTPGEAQAARYDLSKQVDKIHVFPRTNALTGEKDYSVMINLGGDRSLSLGVNKEGVVDNVGASNPEMKGKKLDEIVGKEVAKKIFDRVDNPPERPTALPEGYSTIRDRNGGNNQWGVIPPNQSHAKSLVGWHPTEEEATRQALNHIHYEQTKKNQTLENVDLKIGGEGMHYFYDKMLPQTLEKIGKDYGVKVKDTVIDAAKKDANGMRLKFNDPANKQPIKYIDLPQGLKDTAMQKGFPLFSGGMMINPVAHNPFANETVEANGKQIPINNKQDVMWGAGASNNSNVVNIDSRIPRYDPKLLDKTGKPADLHKYLAIHEDAEKPEMEKLIKEGVPRQKAYLQAHYHTATPAERAAVEADGVDWKEYSEIIDGYLKKTEHENPKNAPADLYTKPYSHNQLRKMNLNRVAHNPFEQ